MRILDRYLIRETLPPFFLALGLFTFLLAVRPMLDSAAALLAKGVPMQTVGVLLLLLLPSSLAITLPMSFLTALLMGFGRLSADRESVALLANGVSPLRLLAPVMAAALVVTGMTMYVLIEGVPDANQRYREIVYKLLVQRTETDIKPRVFYEGFPGKELYFRDQTPEGGWKDVMLADVTTPDRPNIAFAREGHLVLDTVNKKVDIVLSEVRQYEPGTEPGIYEMRSVGDQRQSIDPTTVFSDVQVGRGRNEMTIPQLQDAIREKQAMKPPQSVHNEIMAIQQKFSIPLACVVFAVLGLALGLHTRTEGRMAGFALGLGVIFLYNGMLQTFESFAKGNSFPAVWARWVPNIVMGVIGIIALWSRSRAAGRGLELRLPGFIASRIDPRERARRAEMRRRPVMVLRLPRLPFRISLPGPRLLDRYIAGRYLRMIALTFIGLMGIYYIGTIIDLSDKMLKGHASLPMMFGYLWYSTPQFVYFVIPIATLVAVLGTIGGLTRTNELTVMRACGVSLYRAAAPLVLLSLVWGGALFQLSEGLVAASNRKAKALEDVMKERSPTVADANNRKWLADPKVGRIYFYPFLDAGGFRLLSVFQTTNGPYRLASQTYAKQVVSRNNAWMAEDGWVQTFLENRTGKGPTSRRDSFKTRRLNLPPLTDFRAETDPELMSYKELKDYTARLNDSGFSVSEQLMSLQGKVAYPFVALVMTLLAIPFAVTTGRRGALYGVGFAIGMAVTYWLLSAVFQAAGSAGVMHPAIAAWAANALFALAALYLVLTVKT